MIKKISKKFKKVNSQKGFTLLEILVVLTIMGFLIAMVAPRLAGISGDAVDTVCDSNQNRMVTYMSTYYEDTNRYPDRLTNLVMTDGAALNNAAYHIPTASNDDPADEQEVLSSELYNRNHFYIHHLNDEEREELLDMGIVTALNLNDYTGIANPNLPNDVAPVAAANPRAAMEEVELLSLDITAGDVFAVAMVGCGIDNAAAWDSATEERGWGEPGNFARIVLGMGPECGLITSGVISNAAHCPGGIQNADNVIYNDYILLLPRLATTTARMPAVAPFAIDNITDPAGIDCAAYDEGANLGAAGGYALAGNTELLKIREFDITEAQEGWQFATMCPEGHMYPADDEEFWAVDISNDGSI